MLKKGIGSVMVSLLSSSTVDDGFQFRQHQTKDYKIGICCFSAKHAALAVRAKTGWLGIRILCLNGATCLHADCCFSDIAVKLLPWHETPIQILEDMHSIF